MRALAFARRLLRRWDRRVASPEPLGRIFLRFARPVRVDRSRSSGGPTSVHLHLRPQLSLALTRDGGMTFATSMLSTRASGLPPLAGLVLRTRAAVRAEHVLERMLARGVRVERLERSVPGEPPRAGRPASPLATQRTELVLRRSASRLAGNGRDLIPPTDPVPFNPIGPANGSSAAGASAAQGLDVGRLTEQVLSAIDHRLVAQAERLGRS